MGLVGTRSCVIRRGTSNKRRPGMPTNKTTLPSRMPRQQKGSVETFNAGRAGAHPAPFG